MSNATCSEHRGSVLCCAWVGFPVLNMYSNSSEMRQGTVQLSLVFSSTCADNSKCFMSSPACGSKGAFVSKLREPARGNSVSEKTCNAKRKRPENQKETRG